MTFEELADFIEHRMRMSHVYQPVMIRALLEGGGRATVEEIARAILAHDESQVEYYAAVTNNMVGRVLRNHGIAEKQGRAYVLPGYADLTVVEVARLA
jgi:hypothetical protein